MSFAAATAALSVGMVITAPAHHMPGRVLTTGVSLLTSEALIMSGTNMPDVTPEWMDFVSRNFIEPTVGDGYLNTPVVTPEQFWPITGLLSMSLNKSTEIGWEILNGRVHELIAANQAAGTPDDPIAVFGYSQSSWLAAIEMQSLFEYQAADSDVPPTSFVMLSNPIRPNGGLFSRWFGFGLVRWTPIVSAPTGTPFPAYDIARQYDFFADFPAYPLNLLAKVNAVFGLRNHDYGPVTLNPDDPRYDPDTIVEQYGNTTYYLIPSMLPMLYPLRRVGLDSLADALDPVLRVFVELGYDRTASFGQYTPFKPFPRIDRVALRSDLKAAFAKSVATLKPVAAQAKPLPAASAPLTPPTMPEVPAALQISDVGPLTPSDPVIADVGREESVASRTARDSMRTVRAGAGEPVDPRRADRARPERRVSRAGST